MKFRRYFHEEIWRWVPPDQFSEVRDAIDSRYWAIHPDIAFAANSSNPVDRRLEYCAYFLAAIQVLERRGMGFEQIRQICMAVTESYVRPGNAWQAWWKRLPSKLIGTPVMRLVARFMSAKAGRKGHPDGFLVRIITDPAETYGLGYGFDIVECGICTLFRKHNASAYVPILCEVDRLTSSLAGLDLIRSGTLATGAAQCDFRFKLLKSSR